MIRILVADDHAVIRRGIRYIVSGFHQIPFNLTLRRVAVLSMLGPHVLSSDLLSHERRVDLVSMRLYGADNGR